MTPNPLKNAAGFTYIAALIVVMIMGIMLGAAGKSWKMIADREKETELLFRGHQYRDAITRWYKQGGTAQPPRPPPPLNDLKDLLRDSNSLGKNKYLRRLYLDPITGKEWLPVKDTAQRIIGVSSSSEAQPIKQADFLDEDKVFGAKTKYSDWKFVYNSQQTAATGAPH